MMSRAFAHSGSKCSTRILIKQRHISTTRKPLLRISQEVQDAIKNRKPVVALETTIYTHGFPHPENIRLATELESLVRKHGAVPATIGVLHGVARVGFTLAELNELTRSAGEPGTKKLSRRDLGYVCGLGITGRKLNGGTTVAGTMALAHLAGIKIFATGGLGGVHRGGQNSMDISADLAELGRTPVTVISSGCKSFLDIPRTLEFLETQGVGVGSFLDGRQGDVDFPAFWTRDSGVQSPLVIMDEREAAAIIYAQSSLGLTSGLLFANPIPAKYSIPKARMDAVMTQALDEAERLGTIGSDNTPFVLKKIRELTRGETVAANRYLVGENVIRGAKVAVELAALELQSHERVPGECISISTSLENFTEPSCSPRKLSPGPDMFPSSMPADVVVAGALAVDLSCEFIHDGSATKLITPQLQTSNPAIITQSLGGVGQNIATTLHYLSTPVRLCSLVADDVAGIAALAMLSERGLSTSGIEKTKDDLGTAQYVAFNDAHQDLVLAMADMRILEAPVDFDTCWKPHLTICKPKWVIVDANWDASTLHTWIVAGKASGAKVAYEPVSIAKSKRLFAKAAGLKGPFPVFPHHGINLATPNRAELASMHAAAKEAELFEREDWWRIIDAIGLPSSGSRDKLVALTATSLVDAGVPQQSIQLLPFLPCIATKLGAEGVLLTQLLPQHDERLRSPASAPYILSRSQVSSTDKLSIGGVYMRLFPPVEHVPATEICSVNGVGDTFLGVLVAGLLQDSGRDVVELIDVAQKGSVMTLRSKEAVSPEVRTLRFS